MIRDYQQEKQRVSGNENYKCTGLLCFHWRFSSFTI